MAKDRQPSLNGMANVYRARQLAERGTAPNDEDFSGRYPQLFSLLTNNRIDDKTTCDPAVLRISNSAGDWLLALSIPALAAYTEVLSGTVNDGLARLEALLGAGNVAWKFNLERKPRTRKVQEKAKDT